MSIEFIPAIDLLDGRVVRLLKGDYAKVTVYNENVLDQARSFRAAGANIVHIVDLNAARTGERGKNTPHIREILKETGVKIQIGGGIRDLSSLEEYLTAGAFRCILGTAAAENIDFLKEAILRFGSEQIVLGVDALDNRVRLSGWEKDSGLDADEFLKRAFDLGVTTVIYTDISTDGAMTGPPLGALGKKLQIGPNIIASGGVSSPDDLRKLVSLQHPRLIGVISGRAVYEKKIDVKEAVDICSGRR